MVIFSISDVDKVKIKSKNLTKVSQPTSVMFTAPAHTDLKSLWSDPHIRAVAASCLVPSSHMSKMKLVTPLHRECLVFYRIFPEKEVSATYKAEQGLQAASTLCRTPGFLSLNLNTAHVTKADCSWQLSNLQLKTNRLFINNSLSWKPTIVPNLAAKLNCRRRTTRVIEETLVIQM